MGGVAIFLMSFDDYGIFCGFLLRGMILETNNSYGIFFYIMHSLIIFVKKSRFSPSINDSIWLLIISKAGALIIILYL